MRIVVVQAPPPPGVLPGAPAVAPRVPLPVGILYWHDPEPKLTVIVKLTLSLAGAELALASEQAPLELDRARSAGPGVDLIEYPSDFVPFKPRADLLLSGHAYPDIGSRTRELRARLALGEFDRSWLVTAAEPADRLPLRAPTLHTLTGKPVEHLGPTHPTAAELESMRHEPDFDYSRYNVAAPDMQLPPFVGPLELELEGLSPRGPRGLELPWFVPRLFVRMRGLLAVVEPPVAVDTVWLDTDAERCVLVYRSEPLLAERGAVDRLWVALDAVDAPRSWEEIERTFARGHFGMAVEAAALDPAPADEQESEALTFARHEAMTSETAPEPSVPLERYVSVSAELAEQREPRADVLGRHGFDDDSWLLEERGWLEAMAQRAMAGDGSLANRYSELFVAAQDALSQPEEQAVTVAEYAALAVELEQAEEPHKVLERRGLVLSRWMRLDRRMRRQADADPAFAAELERWLALERERQNERAAAQASGPQDESKPDGAPAASEG